MQEPYLALGQILIAACSNTFETAYIKATLEDGFSDMEYACALNGKTNYVSPEKGKGSEVHEALHPIRKEMTIPGKDPWSRCTFTMFPDGKFKFDVEYDD